MENTASSGLAENSGDSENVRTIKALYLALKSKDKQALSKILVDNPVWDVSPGFPEGGVFCGLAEIFDGFYKKLLARVVSFGAFPDGFVDGGHTVVVLGHYQIVKSEGASPVLVRFAHVWSMDDSGRVKGVRQVADSARFPTS